MKVIKADTLGYCMGVRRAVESAEVALKEYKDKTIYSLGPLIHNTVALEDLSQKGLNIIEEENISLIDSNSVVIIRAHGISPKTRRLLENQNAVIIDATCPRVTVSQNRVAEFSSKGYTIILAGDKGHAEVEGIRGFSVGKFFCIQNLNEAKSLLKSLELEKSTNEKFLLLSQTTFSPIEFEKISIFLKDNICFLEVINTICPATKKRQDALEQLCKNVDAIIVIGGKKSANTIRLYQKAQHFVKNAIHIETACEIPDFFNDFETIGITAGASTPDNVIDEVVQKLYQQLK